MKQTFYLLLSTAFLVTAAEAFAQTQKASLPASEKNIKIKRPTQRHVNSPQQIDFPLLPPNPSVHESARAFGPEVTIGQTYYDLQTNSSVCPRLENHGGGLLSAIWTFSKVSSSSGTWPDRGMAYHYNDGLSWTKLPQYDNVDNITRLENVRTGFGSIARIPGVGDIIVAHQTAIEALQVTRNTSLTEEQFSTAPFTSMALTWPRMRTGGPDGKSVHIIGLTEPTGGEFTGTPYLGINGCLLYNRSIDGGQSFDKLMVLLPGIDSTIYSAFGGDGYALDVKGNTVAFVAGELTTRIQLWKSIDNGETWTTRLIKPFPYEPWKDQLTDANGDGTVADSERVSTCDGSMAILIDNSDKVHVYYGAMEILNSDSTDGSLSYYPGVGGIQYWNEGFSEGEEPRTIAGPVSDDGDTVLNIAVRFANGTTVPYGAGLTTFPSAGIGADGALYVSYSGSKEGDDYKYLGDGPSFKHLYFVKSTDGGATWTFPKDIVGDENDNFDQFAEYAFASMARKVDENIHVLYQRDYVPGSAVTINNGQIHPFDSPNDIVYLKVPKDFLEVGFETVKNEDLNVTLQPNPSSDETQLKFELKQQQQVSVSVVNLLGQNMLNVAGQSAAPGFHTLTLNTSDIPAGIYLVNLQAGNTLTCRKLVVSH